jgi:ParB family chromosome partitioning protein
MDCGSALNVTTLTNQVSVAIVIHSAHHNRRWILSGAGSFVGRRIREGVTMHELTTTIEAEATEQQLIDVASAAVKQSNWVIGEAASKWTERYAAGRTDADFAELIGSSQPAVSYARRVYSQFLSRRDKHDFTWTHWRTLLTWDDAEGCLDWAEVTGATFKEMNAWRNLKHGKPVEPEPVKAPTQTAPEPHEPIVKPSGEGTPTGEEVLSSDSLLPVSVSASQTPPTDCNPAAVSPLPDPKPHVSNNSGEVEWYTPAEIVSLAREVMQNIDLDPASCETANEVVKAAEFYDAEQDGLSLDWQGRVWMNPPYAAGLVGEFAAKLLAEMDAERVSEACVLVNNATETRWFQSLAEQCDSICFPRSRIKFWHPARPQATGLQGQAVLYFGVHTGRFRNEFSELGVTVAR